MYHIGATVFCNKVLLHIGATAYNSDVSIDSDQPPSNSGGNTLLSEAMSETLSSKGWSLRRAAIQTGIPYSTIDRIAKGYNVEAEPVARFALKIADSDNQFETVLKWLRLAKKDDFVSLLSSVAQTATNSSNSAERITLLSGKQILVLPSGREIPATSDNIALIETFFTTLEQAKSSK